MFSRWGAFVYRFRRPVALIAVIIAIASSVLATQTSSALSAGGWLDADSESAAVAARLDTEFGAGKSSVIALFRSGRRGPTPRPTSSRGPSTTATAGLSTVPEVTGIIGYAETGDPRFISTAGDAAYIVVELNVTDEESVEVVDPIRAAIVPPAGYTFQLTGYGPITKDSAEQSEKDLQKAEIVSLPIVALVLILVFASIVAAGMPLLVAGLAIPSSLALIYLVAQQVEMSIFVLNIATMLGLALAIDYSLFIVSRYREELRRGRTVAEAVERAVSTAGKAIAFSGVAVAIGLSGLLLFEAPAIRSIGIAGAIVVLCSVVFALTFLPAILGMLGHRVNALSLSGLRHRFRPVADGVEPARTARWERVAHAVMRRPIAVLVPTLAFLLIVGSPFLRLEQGVPGAEIYPPGVESRDAYVALQTEFAPGETTPIIVLADVQGSPDRPRQHQGPRRLRRAGRRPRGDRPGREPVHHPRPDDRRGADARTGRGALCPARRPATGRSRGSPRPVRPRQHGPARRDQPAPAVAPGGDRPDPGHPRDPGRRRDHDPGRRQRRDRPRLPRVAGGARAVRGRPDPPGQRLHPVPAVRVAHHPVQGHRHDPAVDHAPASARLVWIFQEGNLSNLLNFEPLGYTIAGNPIIMFSVIFGLSMDYEVLLLSRIQEAYRRTGDNTASVAEGLSKTAGVITGAALIMVSVFAAFALAEVITIKSIGVGMAIAVAVDATIVRVLLVPATMRLMGKWNWWAPGILGRFVDRLGFSHVEDAEDDASTGTPGTSPRLAGS